MSKKQEFEAWIMENHQYWLVDEFQQEAVKNITTLIAKYGEQKWIVDAFDYIDALIIAKQKFDNK